MPVRPKPTFYEEPTLSTKKEKHSSIDFAGDLTHLPRLPAKSCPPISRFFPHTTWQSEKPLAVTFKSRNGRLLRSKHYNESSNDLYFEQCFDVEAKIGEGSFGEVFRVRSKEDGKLYAVKRALEQFRSISDRQKKLREVQKHETLPKHPNLVTFVRAWEERGCLYIQTELCESSLLEYAERHHSIPEWKVWHFLVDLLQGINHLHMNNLVHLDIKPENIFVSRDGFCKLGDFGLVTDMDKLSGVDVDEGDARYLAPEVLHGHVSAASDIFSVGLTVLEMAFDLDVPKTGEPWQLLRSGHLSFSLRNNFRNRNVSGELLNIIDRMMDPNPSLRPTASQLLRCKAIANVRRERTLYRWVSCQKRKIQDFFLWICTQFVIFFTFIASACLSRSNASKHAATPVSSTHHNLSFKASMNKAKTIGAEFWRHKRHWEDVNAAEMTLSNQTPRALSFEDAISDDEDDVLIGDLSSIHNHSNGTEPISAMFTDSESFIGKSPVTAPWKSTPVQKTFPRSAMKAESKTKDEFSPLLRRALTDSKNVRSDSLPLSRLRWASEARHNTLPPKKLLQDFDDNTSSSGSE